MARDPGAFRVVGIGASAGGLEACSNLLDALPAGDGLAFILVQHLEPTHESMMVDLLATHTWMTVRQAANGMPIEPNHLYIIPPGTYLSVAHGALQVTPPQARHGARLPFDFLLHSLGAEFGPRAICVVLSGTGADGTLGLATVKENGGTVIAQDPEEAAYDGMPRSAIATGAVDMVLTVANIAKALVGDGQRKAPLGASSELVPHDYMPEIIELLRVSTTHDFSLYKPGTLRRRTERRMAMASIGSADTARYLAMLRSDRRELDLLANDLLINVTNFFRDPKSFEVLVETVLPDLLRNQTPDHPLRIWIPGCSTGEEAYSLAMIFREQITAGHGGTKLQIFASDVDPDAVATAREALYPASIAADVSPARLARFFVKERQGSLGPTDGYLKVVLGLPSNDLLTMVREGVQIKLRSALLKASQERTRITVDGGKVHRGGDAQSFSIAVQPVRNDGEELFLVCFIDRPNAARTHERPTPSGDVTRVVELEQELDVARADLQDALHNLQLSNEEQNAVNEEALSVNEEFQSTNEELSK